jgi:hypothetical protein
MKLFQNLALIAAGLVASVVVINSNQSAQAAGVTLTGPTSSSPYDFDLSIAPNTNFGTNSTVSIFYQGPEATEDSSSSSDFSIASTSTVQIGGSTYEDTVFSAGSNLSTGGSSANYTLALDSTSLTYAGNIIIATTSGSSGTVAAVYNSGTVPVPEPGAIGGSAIALGLGAWLKRKKALSV